MGVSLKISGDDINEVRLFKEKEHFTLIILQTEIL